MAVDPIRRRLMCTAPLAVGLSSWSGIGSPRAEDRSEGKPQTGREIRVGPARDIKSLRQAAALARDGDQVLLDPGEYRGDVAVWTQRRISIMAAGGQATLVADGAIAEGKGIFVFRGGDARVANLTFVGARSSDRNGAGIRLDVGGRLTVSHCRFENNENGILTSNDPSSELHLIDSEFLKNGAGDGQSHNVYVGLIARLTATGCYFGPARVGHLLKSRARESLVTYSRLSGEDGTSSYELEFPSGGRATVLGCLIQQGPKSENSTMVSYGAEGYRWEANRLEISFCTLVNDRPGGGVFVRSVAGEAPIEVVDNVLIGSGQMDLRTTTPTARNHQAKGSDFADVLRLDFRLRRSSNLVGGAGLAGALDPRRMRPMHEYVHPASSVALGPYSQIAAFSPGAFQRLAP